MPLTYLPAKENRAYHPICLACKKRFQCIADSAFRSTEFSCKGLDYIGNPKNITGMKRTVIDQVPWESYVYFDYLYKGVKYMTTGIAQGCFGDKKIPSDLTDPKIYKEENMQIHKSYGPPFTP